MLVLILLATSGVLHCQPLSEWNLTDPNDIYILHLFI